MIILKNKKGDFIYLDVVTQYSRNFSSSVSQHPVDGSGTISDHVIKQNPKIQLTGNISGADFNSGKPVLSPEDRSFIGIGAVVIESNVATVVEINAENNISDLLPDVVGQFFPETRPEIENLNEGRDTSEQVLFGVLKGFYEDKEELTLYEFDGGVVSAQPLESIFITNLSVNESATTGDSLAFNITLERVTISNLLEEELPEDVQEDFVTKNAEKSNKGEKSSQESPSLIQELRGDNNLFSFLKSIFGG